MEGVGGENSAEGGQRWRVTSADALDVQSLGGTMGILRRLCPNLDLGRQPISLCLKRKPFADTEAADVELRGMTVGGEMGVRRKRA